ncbi:3735_t:CDS:2 [Entrophospora sp. SA101]|nr:3735_t:CDS:2 [Entrophospora sp. SA101]
MAQVGGDNGAAEDATSTIIEKLKPAISETKQVIGHAAQKSKNWFTYGVIALNAIPLTILLTFLFVTTSIVVLIIGTRIFLAKGFFIEDNTTSLSFDTQHILSKTSKVLTGGKEGGIGGDASRGKKNLIEEIIILLY